MDKVIHRSGERGYADHGWLKSYHSFSFAGYYDPEKVNFGALRVLNDDSVAPGKGFGMHPHENMEIISIPLSGELEHKDNMGNATVIRTGDVQIMSAGTGVKHSEFNHSKSEPVKFFQIWVFPKEKNIQPRYDQRTFDIAGRINQWQLVVAPGPSEQTVTINQDAWFSLGNPQKGTALDYKLNKPGNGVYLFVIEGSVEVTGETLQRRDAIGLDNLSEVKVNATSDSQLLLMEIPMK
ncbi:pirin family protein [Cytophagaceae bacterium ABcell3]|nr:pirin family protein [Cytophagaceae bacterium ABcell3]